jgi:glucan phosphorylase
LLASVRFISGLDRPTETYHEKWALQLNDKRPAKALAESMRLLVDQHSMHWDPAWNVTRNTFPYTNAERKGGINSDKNRN